jgi:glycosyltransferase involved in cell wall biosynthesis
VYELRPVRIAFDGRSLTSPAGGVRRYVRELFGAMQGVAPRVVITAVGAHRSALVPPGVRCARAGASLPTNLGRSLTGLPIGLRRIPFDVFHAPAYTAPLWGARPLVLTIHDVSYARHPEWYPYRIDPIRHAFYRASARRADRILTDSAFSRDEIVAAFDVDPARIDIVPLGVSPRFAPDPGTARERFVLHVGDLHPRRNLSMLLDVVLTLRQTATRCADLRLVLVGADRGSLDSLRKQGRAAGDALVYAGTLSDDELIALYRRAAVFAYPSRYEGFGLPLLEAMACGTPVVASKAASVPEVVGTAAPLVSVDDAAGWRDALHAILDDPSHAATLRARGLARAAAFSWERTASGTIACYQAARDRS